MSKSVFLGKDNEVLSALLNKFGVINPRILDCTYNEGKMWAGSVYKPYRMDINPKYELDCVGDFTQMPFRNNEFDVIVFDPPYYPTKEIFDSFLSEAKRVIKPNGIILAKIFDVIHEEQHLWQQVEFFNSVKNSNLVVQDMIIKANLNVEVPSNPDYFMIVHCYWIVVKKKEKSFL